MSESAIGARSRRRAPGELTPRQREVLDLLAKRHTNSEIADRLGISLSAAKWHVSEIIGELGVDTREEAADWWREQNGLRTRLWRNVSAAMAMATSRPVAVGAAAVAVVAVVAVAAALLWRGGDETVPAGGDETPTATTSPTVGTATPTASPTPDPFLAYETYPAPGRDELVVYTVFVEDERSEERSWPVRAVVVQDLATGQVTGHWKYSGADTGGPRAVAIAGDFIIVANHLAVRRYTLDGHDPVVLYQANGDDLVADVAVSPDGLVVAVGSECAPCVDRGGVTFLDPTTGNTISDVRTTTLNDAGFRGYVWQMSYLPDGSGVVIGGGTGSERPGGRATVFVDGTFSVDLADPEGYAAISPDGTLLAEPYGYEITGICFHTASDSLRIRDFTTDRAIVDYTPADAAVNPREWSPDGKHLLFVTLAITSDEECSWMDSPSEYHLLEVATGTITPVPDFHALQRQWYGDELVEVGCSDWSYDQPVRTRYGKLDAVCRMPDGSLQPGDVYVGGVKVASWPGIPQPSGSGGGIELVGFID